MKTNTPYTHQPNKFAVAVRFVNRTNDTTEIMQLIHDQFRRITSWYESTYSGDDYTIEVRCGVHGAGRWVLLENVKEV